MKQNKDREEFELFCDKLRIKKCVREYPCQRCDTWFWIETHTKKKVEEALNNIREE